MNASCVGEDGCPLTCDVFFHFPSPADLKTEVRREQN